ncbi:hypothetical protein Csa_023812, partial [Cucumis sativus]
ILDAFSSCYSYANKVIQLSFFNTNSQEQAM